MTPAPVPDGPFAYLVFDLGGVLVQFSGEARLMEWTHMEREDLWSAWLRSETVREFELGQSEPQDFATRIVAEFDLPISAQDFLIAFESWPRTLFPGTINFLEAIGRLFPIACMSNTNPVHWPYIRDRLGLGQYFVHTSISYETGFLKPDPEAFTNLHEMLKCEPDQIAFFDDNEINTRSAINCGMTATTVHGIAELVAALAALDIQLEF